MRLILRTLVSQCAFSLLLPSLLLLSQFVIWVFQDLSVVLFSHLKLFLPTFHFWVGLHDQDASLPQLRTVCPHLR